jgi:hypothetical protein
MFDERFVMHRYKSTSHAAVVGAVAMGGWFLYQHYARDTLRLDILVIMLAMAVTKLGSMLYYRLRD